MLGKLSVSGSC
ncbi:hypothetical protein LINPERHAP1_LOCUS26099 [Linum perenne]